LSNFELQLNTKVYRAVRTGFMITGIGTEDNKRNHVIVDVNDGGKVILAAGALSTPRILFRSGIGPAA
jgi:cellobiose dehydrogenase (acceptor)